MSRLIQRLPSVRSLPKTTKTEPTTYHYLDIDQDILTSEIKTNFKNADDLLAHIETLLSQGIFPDEYFVELVATFEEKDLKKLKDKINQIYAKIINIYVDTLIAICQDAINAVNISELCSPKTSVSLNKRVNELSDNFNSFLSRKILGFDSLRKAQFPNNSITENERLRRRTIRLHMWIDIAKRSLDKHNDMGGILVITALDNQALRRLKKTIKGLNDVAKQKLHELLDFKDMLFTSKGATEYFTRIITKNPVIPYHFGILKPIIQVAENEKEQTDNKSIWQKIEQCGYMDEVKILLLKEQHDVFALALPIWEFVTTKSADVTRTYEIKGLIDRIYINQLDMENAYAISTLFEPVISLEQANLKSLAKDLPDQSDLKPLPNDIMLYELDKKESVLPILDEELVIFKKWLKNNYLNKLKSLHELLPTLASLNKALTETPTDYSLARLEKHFDINEASIVTIFQVLHSANILRCLSSRFGLARLDIDKNLLDETIRLLSDLKLSISEIRKMYFEIHQRNMIGQEDNIEYASLKADIADLSKVCEGWANEIETHLKSWNIYNLKKVKLTFKKLRIANAKYKAYVEDANQFRSNIGIQILTSINKNYAQLQFKLQKVEKLLTEKEFHSINSQMILEDFINNWTIRLHELSKTFETCTAKEANPKRSQIELNDLIMALEDLIIEFPLLVDRKYYKDKEHLYQQIHKLKEDIIRLIQHTENALKNTKQQKQKNKSPLILSNPEVKQNITVLHKKYPAGQSSFILLPKIKLQNDLSQLICRRLNIPVQYKIGKFVSDQSSLFNALAKSLNSLYGENHFDEQTLRLICFDFYLNNRERVIKWQNVVKPDELEADPYLKIRYTQHDMSKLFNKDALGSKFAEEGRMLCTALKLNAIFVIELQNKSRNNALEAKYYMITPHQISIVKSINYLQCIDQKVPIILLNQDGYYLPLQLTTQHPNLTSLVTMHDLRPPSIPDINHPQRVKISNEDAVKKLITGRIPNGYSLEAAISAGDCFFDAVAQATSYLTQRTITVKSLRLMCVEAAINKNDIYPWLKEALKKDEQDKAGYDNYLARIAFTCNEMAEHEKNKTLTGTATWGRPEIEGRLFAAEFDIELHIIEVLDQPVNGVQVIETIVNKNGSRQIEQMLPEGYLRPNTIHVLNHHLHFVPLLYQAPRQELAVETTTPLLEKPTTTRP